MKHFKLTAVVLSLLLFFLGNNAFSQVKLPLSGTYKAPIGADFEKLEINENRINTFKDGAIVGTFFAVEKVEDSYVLEITKPGTQSVDYNPNRDRKLIKVKINEINEKECHLTITWHTGIIENLTLNK